MKRTLGSTLLAAILCFVAPSAEAQDGSWWNRLLGRDSEQRRTPGKNERMHSTVLEAFSPISETLSKSTVRLVSKDEIVALGAIVGTNGWILSKASEVETRDLLGCVLPDGSKVDARVVEVDGDHDLALLHVPLRGLSPVQWNLDDPPGVGSWAISCDGSDLPISVGVISVDSRKVGPNRAFMGIQHDPSTYRITQVTPNSGAAAAGLRSNDILLSINGVALEEPDALGVLLAEFEPNETIRVQLRRRTKSNEDDANAEKKGESGEQDEVLHLDLTLGDRQAVLGNEDGRRSRRLEGALSARRTSFSSVLQHDSVLRPKDCGGPLVDLSGRVVGINIARAGRVNSYAVPSAIAHAFVEEAIESAESTVAVSAGSGHEARLDKVDDELERLRDVVELMTRWVKLDDQIRSLERELKVTTDGAARTRIENALKEARGAFDRVHTALDD
ncbi:MAG: trypsin-like peptidase domain-containing protein [Planctomycetota bacterium]